jgi:hypothetical protein
MNDQSQQQQHQSQRDTSTVASSPSLLKKRSRQDRMGVANPPEKSAEEVFFGFHPVSFVDDVVNAVNDYAYDGVDYLEGKLRADRIVARNVQLQNEAAEGSNLVLAQFQQSLDVNFDKLELYLLQNILKIPNDIQVALLCVGCFFFFFFFRVVCLVEILPLKFSRVTVAREYKLRTNAEQQQQKQQQQ